MSCGRRAGVEGHPVDEAYEAWFQEQRCLWGAHRAEEEHFEAWAVWRRDQDQTDMDAQMAHLARRSKAFWLSDSD